MTFFTLEPTGLGRSWEGSAQGQDPSPPNQGGHLCSKVTHSLASCSPRRAASHCPRPRAEPRPPSCAKAPALSPRKGCALGHLFGFLQGVVVEGVSVQGLQEGRVQVPAGLHELPRQAQLLLQHVVERQRRRAVSCQGCTSCVSLPPSTRLSPKGYPPTQQRPRAHGQVRMLSGSAATRGTPGPSLRACVRPSGAARGMLSSRAEAEVN